MLGCFVFLYPSLGFESLPEPYRLKKSSSAVKAKCRVSPDARDRISLTHGKSPSCAGQNSFVASTSVSKAGPVHSFMHVNHPNVLSGKPEVRRSNRHSSQTACLANRNFLRPKFFQPASIARSPISPNENERSAERRASKRVIGSRKISAVNM